MSAPSISAASVKRWRVGDYVFDADTRQLIRGDHRYSLEPKAATLLAYFCQNPGRDIGRDELLDAVWYGQVVSDNSINRVIVLLRKALKDEDKARQYIATVPKLGYRLIARVAAEDEPVATSPGASAGRRWWAAVVAIALIAVAMAVVLTSKQEAQTTLPQTSVVPLSRLALSQSNADLSSDGQTLIFTARDGDYSAIFAVPEGGAQPQPISAPGGHADFAVWAHDGSFVVYRYVSGQRCELHRLARAQFAARNADVVYECLPDSYSEMSLSLDNTALYFTERPTAFAPYSVYALDLAGRVKRRLSQPVAQGYGNHFVDVHPRSGELLVLSDHAPGRTSVYQVDPVSGTFELARQFDYGLDSAIWSHRDNAIVHPSEHPSYDLLETPLRKGDSRVLVSDSRRIASPRRIAPSAPAQQDYLFTSYLFNRDVDVLHVPESGFNSAVMDYLPALSNDTTRVAFVSKRSGYSQVWIKDFESRGLTRIESADSGRRFLSLMWSDDDRRLLANTNTGVVVYAVDEGQVLHDIDLPLPAYGVHWHDDTTLAFSHYQDGRFHAYRYALDTGEREALDPRWAFSVRNVEQSVYLDASLAAHRDGRQLAELDACARLVWRYQLRLYLDGDQIYCHARDAYADLLQFDASLAMTRREGLVERFEFVSVESGHVARTRVASSHSDIMRTSGPER